MDINADTEFECIHDDIEPDPIMNIVAHNDHIPEIERSI